MKRSSMTFSAAVAVSIVAAAAGVQSFSALIALGGAARLPCPWLLPVSIDGLALVASLSTLVLRNARRRSTRLYAPIVVLAAAAFSTYANGLAGLHVRLTSMESASLAAVAPIVAVVAAHILLLLTAPAAGTVAVKSGRSASLPKVRAANASAAAPRTVSPTKTSMPGTTRADVVARALSYREEHGSLPAGTTLGLWLGQSRKSGSRLRAELLATE